MDTFDQVKSLTSSWARTKTKEDFEGITEKQISKMSDKELALWQYEQKEDSPHRILAQHEWQRRLTERHIKWMRFSVVSGFIGILIGAFLGAYFTSMFSHKNNQESSDQTGEKYKDVVVVDTSPEETKVVETDEKQSP